MKVNSATNEKKYKTAREKRVFRTLYLLLYIYLVTYLGFFAENVMSLITCIYMYMKFMNNTAGV